MAGGEGVLVSPDSEVPRGGAACWRAAQQGGRRAGRRELGKRGRGHPSRMSANTAVAPITGFAVAQSRVSPMPVSATKSFAGFWRAGWSAGGPAASRGTSLVPTIIQASGHSMLASMLDLAEQADGLALVQRVPHHLTSGSSAAPTIASRLTGAGAAAVVEQAAGGRSRPRYSEQQDQFGGQRRIPVPPGAPPSACPCRSCRWPA